MVSVSKYFKKVDTRIVFVGDELEIYVPQSYFEAGLAEAIGDRFHIFGILSVKCKNGSKSETATLNIPTYNNFYPPQTYNDVDAQGEKVLVMKFFKNDAVMDKATRSDMENSQLFLKMICSGKLPSTIPYSKLLEVWDTNLSSNNMNYQVSSTIKEIILAEMNRTKGKPEQKYSVVMGKNPGADQYGYEPTSINKVCSMSSTFSAITFENMDEMIITSVNMRRYGKQEKDTPLEKIIKM